MGTSRQWKMTSLKMLKENDSIPSKNILQKLRQNKYIFRLTKTKRALMVWLSRLGAVLQSKQSSVQFAVRAGAWVVG